MEKSAPPSVQSRAGNVSRGSAAFSMQVQVVEINNVSYSVDYISHCQFGAEKPVHFINASCRLKA